MCTDKSNGNNKKNYHPFTPVIVFLIAKELLSL